MENSAIPAMPVASTTSTTSASWFDSIKESAHTIWLKIKDSKSLILDILLFFGIGFLIGFFLRKYGQYVAALIVFVVLLIVLAQLNILDIGINWTKIQQILGMQPAAIPEGGALMNVYWTWLKSNIFSASSFCVGFLVGLRMS